ncbi:MAG: hypothetical protein EOP22_09660 [Hyphomicrobiales bacterium]|nr:MAG: hypothetical protein EOP22_09660 [Hyphomicrobiales bacterium]
MPSPAARAETARLLREEAHALLAESGLFALLVQNFAEPTVTGSAGYDLMVWRDIDIHMAVEAERYQDWMAFGGKLVRLFDRAGTPLHEAIFLNDWVDPDPLGAGLYWGLKFKDGKGDPWKIDLWGWDPFDFAVRQARDFSLRTDLAACDRDLILRLKTEARARDNYYGVRVSSFDIYQFCIARAGDSLSALEMWKKQL